MTATTFYWYRDTRHYLDDRGVPSGSSLRPGRAARPDLPARSRPRADRPAARGSTIPPDVTHVFGGYWDVYRLAFLSGGRVGGIPFPMYPNRFPGWSVRARAGSW